MLLILLLEILMLKKNKNMVLISKNNIKHINQENCNSNKIY